VVPLAFLPMYQSTEGFAICVAAGVGMGASDGFGAGDGFV
jgi:hypothetical protein